MKKILILFIFSIVSIYPAFAETWTINPAHSEILFEVPYLKWSEVTGKFRKFSGSVFIDEKTLIPKEVQIEIHSASVDTGNEMRDGHLRGQDFFQSKFYPFIKFKSTKIIKVNAEDFDVFGELTIKKVSRPHRLRIKSSQIIKDTWGYENLFVKFSTEVNRKDYDLNWNKTIESQEFLIGDVIKIRGSLQWQPKSKMTPSSKHMIPDTPYIREREKLARGEISETGIKQEITKDSLEASKQGLEKPSAPKTVQVNGKTPIALNQKQERSQLWWICFGALGFFGFVGVTIAGLYFKKIFVEKYRTKYEEIGFIGILSDFIMIGLVFLYSLSYWFVGWG
jgi:polyisoprenoid-binding protein YceI